MKRVIRDYYVGILLVGVCLAYGIVAMAAYIHDYIVISLPILLGIIFILHVKHKEYNQW